MQSKHAGLKVTENRSMTLILSYVTNLKINKEETSMMILRQSSTPQDEESFSIKENLKRERSTINFGSVRKIYERKDKETV